MATFKVVDKSNENVVFEYSSDTVVEWEGFPLSLYEHQIYEEVVEVAPLEKRQITKYQFVSRIGDAAFGVILQMAKTQPEVEVWVEKFKLLTPDPDGTSVDLNDPETIAGIASLSVALEGLGVVDASWKDKVLS